MTDRNLILVVAAYGEDDSAAAADYAAIKEIGDTAVVAAVVLQRDAEGEVKVKEHGGGIVAAGTGIGAVVGICVGLFAPPLIAATAVGAVVGAEAGKIVKHHEEKKIGVDAEEWLPNNSSAIVAVVDDLYLDRVDKAITKASKKIDKAIDKGDYEAIVKAINEGGDKVVDAINS